MSRRNRKRRTIDFDKVDLPRPNRRRQMSTKRRWRIFVRVLLVVVIIQLVVLEMRPKNEQVSTVKNYDAAISDFEDHYHGDNIVLGESATEIKGLKEIPAKLASLKMLGKASAEAQKLQLATVLERKQPLEVENSVGMRFRLIPPGDFIMGSPDNERGREKVERMFKDVEAQTTVEIKTSFYMGKFEVTNAQWKAVMGTKQHTGRSYKGANCPVEEVTWNEAVRFCKKLATMEGLPIGSYRLPKENEWEYACRAGSYGAFCFAKLSDAPKFMDFRNNNGLRTNVVGVKRPNAWGLFNMHGNVFEWCHDYFKDQYTGKRPDGLQKSIRGGSWYHEWKDCRSANRARLAPTSHGNMLGFRVIRLIKTLPQKPVNEKDNETK